MSLWRNNGSNAVIVSGSNLPINCVSCPCGCSGDVIADIRERQQAFAVAEVMTGNKTIISGGVYPLDPNGAARDVTLGTLNNIDLAIHNTDVIGGDALTIKNNAGSQVDTLAPQESASYDTSGGVVTSPSVDADAIASTWLIAASTYDLSLCTEAVNIIASNYIDGAYTGAAAKPTLLDGTYADAAATCAELATLVLDMLTTYSEDVFTTTNAHNIFNTNGHASQALALAAMRAGTMTGGTGINGDVFIYIMTWEVTPGAWTARAFNRDVAADVIGMSPILAKSLRIFTYPGDDSIETFDAQGWANVVEDQYSNVDESGALGAAVTAYNTTIGLGTTMAPNDPAPLGGAINRLGWHGDGPSPDEFVLRDWTFTNP